MGILQIYKRKTNWRQIFGFDDHLKAAKDLWNQLMIHWKNMEEYLETSRALGRLQKYNIKTYWKLWFVVDDDMEDLWHQLMNHWKKINHQC